MTEFANATRQVMHLDYCFRDNIDRSPHCVHLKVLLDAETSSVSGDVDRSKKLYDEAIVLAARTGLTFDRALANEQAFLCLQDGDSECVQDSKEHYRMALQVYYDFGALSKVNNMLANNVELVDKALGVDASTQLTVSDATELPSAPSVTKAGSVERFYEESIDPV